MSQLPIHMTVSHGPDETPVSLCSRNALLVGRTARDFCRDAGFTFQDVVDGKPSAIGALARRCRADLGLLGKTVTVKIGERRYTIGDQALTRDTLSRKTLRVCPHCLAQDIESGRGPHKTRPYGRLHWLIDPIRTCREHGVELVSVSDDEHPQRVHDFSMLVQPSLPDIDRLASEAPQRRWSPLEDHLAGRLEAPESGETPWLSALPFHAAAKACEMLGAVANHGIRFATDALSDADWHKAGAAGYEFAAAGEPGIRKLLTRLQESFQQRKSDWGPRSVFGRLYEWLAHESDDPAYDPLRDIIRRHVTETMPVGPGDEIFGGNVTIRRLHSVRSASLETGAHPKRLRKLLHAAGHIPAEALALSDERIVFDADDARGFLERITETMSLKEAGKYLNAPRPQERHLFEAGHILPFVMGGTEILKDHAFAKRDLDAFLDRLLADATALAPGDGGFQPISAAAQKATCSTMKVVELILERKLARIRFHPDVAGYLSVLVDPNEVKGLLYEPKDGSLSLREVEKRLGSSTRVVTALIEHDHLSASTVVNPVTRLKQRVVSEEELGNFMKRFVTLHTLAKETGIYFRKLVDQFSEDGIEPAFDPATMHATFYERCLLPMQFIQHTEEALTGVIAKHSQRDKSIAQLVRTRG